MICQELFFSITIIISLAFFSGCGSPGADPVSDAKAEPSMDNDEYKYAVLVYNEAAQKVKLQNGTFDAKRVLCIFGQ